MAKVTSWLPKDHGRHKSLSRKIFRHLAPSEIARLHSAIGFIAPKDRLDGRQDAIQKACDKKLKEARERRKIIRQKHTINTNHNQQLTIAAVA
jgi:hypothetical protein